METGPSPLLGRLRRPLKPSLEGWKHILLRDERGVRTGLETFLRGMETLRGPASLWPRTRLETFLRGMETVAVKSGHGTGKSTLETFLRGMETF